MTTSVSLPSKDMWAFAKRFTRADCERLEESGFLDYPYELMDGVIIPQMGQHMPHASTVSEALAWLYGNIDKRYILSQTSITVAPSETEITNPIPDVILLNKLKSNVVTNEPAPSDIDTIMEVSSSTLDYDLGTKAGVYSRAGIAQYLVLDVNGRVIYNHTLTASGDYERKTLAPGDAIVLLHAPTLALTVDDLLLP